ncbi:hypothetical protein JCM3765_007495 [Sporobolomyces pararoseus]
MLEQTHSIDFTNRYRKLPRCTADSSVASTSKLRLPSSPSPSSRSVSPSVLPPTPASILLSSISSSLPTTESGFYQLLRRIHSTFPSIKAEWFYQFYSSHTLNLSSEEKEKSRKSIRIWSFLLNLAFGETNLKLVKRILGDLKLEERELNGDKRDLGRTLLKGYRKLGMKEEAREILSRLQEKGVGGEPREWITEGRHTKRVSVGSNAKGKGKAREEAQDAEGFAGGEGVGWKGWTIRTRDLERARLGQQDNSAMITTAQIATGSRKVNKKVKKRPPTSETTPSPSNQRPRARILIPPRPELLSSSSLTQLVQLLVQDQRTDEAYTLSELWLFHNKPNLPSLSSYSSSPSSELITLSHKYNSTLFVIANILLKPLLLSRSRVPALLSFLENFISLHSPSPPLPQPLPPLSTLRELLSGLKGSKDAWRTGKRLIDRFGYKWGLPISEDLRGFEKDQGRLRLRFQESEGINRRNESGPRDSSRGKEEEVQGGLKARPHRYASPSVAVIVFRHALDSHRDPLTKLDDRDLQRFRNWWEFVTAREGGSDWFKGNRMKGLLLRAREVGLLDPTEAYKISNDKRRRSWFLTRQRRISHSRKRGKFEKEQKKNRRVEDKST